jgi:hypothetical protein
MIVSVLRTQGSFVEQVSSRRRLQVLGLLVRGLRGLTGYQGCLTVTDSLSINAHLAPHSLR